MLPWPWGQSQCDSFSPRSPQPVLYSRSPEWFMFLLSKFLLFCSHHHCWLFYSCHYWRLMTSFPLLAKQYMLSRKLGTQQISHAFPDHSGYLTFQHTQGAHSTYFLTRASLHFQTSDCLFSCLYTSSMHHKSGTRFLSIILLPSSLSPSITQQDTLRDSPLKDSLILNQTAWFQILILSLTAFETLGKFLSLSEQVFPHL